MENHFDRPMRTITKIANIGCLLLTGFFVYKMFMFSLDGETFNTGNSFDDWYAFLGGWVAALGSFIGSIFWFKYRLDNNV